MQMNVINEYTYTLEMIVQAGRNSIPMEAVDVRTNAELRPSRLFSSMFGYIKKSMLTITRAYVMYKPLRFFVGLGSIPLIIGVVLGVRFIIFMAMGVAGGHVHSLILCSLLIMVGIMIMVLGVLADTIAANRKIIEDVQKRVRRMDYEIEIKKMIIMRIKNGREEEKDAYYSIDISKMGK